MTLLLSLALPAAVVGAAAGAGWVVARAVAQHLCQTWVDRVAAVILRTEARLSAAETKMIRLAGYMLANYPDDLSDAGNDPVSAAVRVLERDRARGGYHGTG